jgi:hypothetical protein
LPADQCDRDQNQGEHRQAQIIHLIHFVTSAIARPVPPCVCRAD